ncbi:putative regulator [Vibrio nigripulchritudo SFn27]|nr:helix-turn-helix transcriptional regulator [Vibrio nigripulchritudo]CCN81103.1 putative regulator [Vibrio nigripulchritudo BLFn1]CCN86555.1 putative regulator [Vibrio nigripulchritudo SFn27]CCN92870.1 putative regulator [Vibrio nigripulchritudo ENn2]CCO40171.1 putative regulator [Vibrio nigripulchritudo SFn135]CCO52364.1 putative regulator [Vibrio nigripulchritudo Wn13]
MINNQEINQFIIDIYTIAYEHSVNSFKHAAFSRLSELVNVDMGFWLTRSELQSLYSDEYSFAYNLPSDVMQNYTSMHSVSKVAHDIADYLCQNKNKAFDVRDIVKDIPFEETDLYKKHCKKYDIEYSVVMATMSHHSNIFNSFSFGRGINKNNFTSEEKQVLEFITPNLVEALRINLLSSINTTSCHNSAIRGVVDLHGRVIESEDRFDHLMRELNCISENAVNMTFLQDHNIHAQYGLSVEVNNYDGLVFLEIHKTPVAEQFSKKKMRVCQLLCQGLSTKEIAREMFISTNAVNNHIKFIYKALNVNSRCQAIALLMQLNDSMSSSSLLTKKTGHK